MVGINAFPTSRRLLKTDDYSSVFRFRCSYRTEHFQLMGMPNHQAYARLGIIVSKKNYALAVERNYFKRLVRDTFRLNQIMLIGLDIIVRANKPYTPNEFSLVRQELVHAFEKINKCRM
ncbi:MAG: ribonuclease P protein component [Burkholderiales bacterium]